MKQLNFKNKIVPVLGLAVLLLQSACSTQFRESQPQVSQKELKAAIEQMSVGPSQTGLAQTDFDTLMTDATGSLYYGISSGGRRPAVSLLSLNSLSVFDPAVDAGLSSEDVGLDYAEVIFFDGIVRESTSNLVQGKRYFALMIRMEFLDGAQVFFKQISGEDAYEFTDNDFAVTMRGANGEELILRSKDISQKVDSELGATVKLDVYQVVNGSEFYVGQISSLHGYGGLDQ